MNANSHLTAIARKTLPAPTRWLLKQDAIVQPVLDYGCGRCHSVNNEHFACDGFDFHRAFPQTDLNHLHYDYRTILCNYVLCTLPVKLDRQIILTTIQFHLADNGLAFIAVRNDKPRAGWGFNKCGTYQGRVQKLPLRQIYQCSQFRIYLLTKQDKVIY